MTADLVTFVERLWLDLWNERDMEAMMDLMDPAFVQHDHRPLNASGTTREDWRKLIEGWWALVPDMRCTEASVIAAAPPIVAYKLRFEGTDAISGGRLENVLSVVNRMEGGRAYEAHIFDSADEAAAYFATRS